MLRRFHVFVFMYLDLRVKISMFELPRLARSSVAIVRDTTWSAVSVAH